MSLRAALHTLPNLLFVFNINFHADDNKALERRDSAPKEHLFKGDLWSMQSQEFQKERRINRNSHYTFIE